MHYDPVKYTLAKLLRGSLLRRAFHLGLDLLFLRAWWIRRELKRIKEHTLHFVQSDSKTLPPQQAGRKMRILDAGMGFGQYSDRLARMFSGAKVTGLEIDRAHLYGGEAYFRSVHPGFTFTVGDVQILPFKSASFDLIVTVDVMEHIPDDRATFAEYARVLRPGGRLLMHTPRDSSPPGTVNIYEQPPAEGVDRWTVSEHVRDGYRDSDAREKLEAAGLTIEHIVRGYGVPGKIAWTLLQRVPISLLGVSKLFIPVVCLWLVIVIIPATIFMAIDVSTDDRPEGGSLLVVARKN